MTVAISCYLVLFVVGGAWSVWDDLGREPLVEILCESAALLILTVGVVFWLIATRLPPGNGVWVLPVVVAAVFEGVVTIRARRRKIEEELASGMEPGEVSRLVPWVDFVTALYFAPAFVLNLHFALR